MKEKLQFLSDPCRNHCLLMRKCEKFYRDSLRSRKRQKENIYFIQEQELHKLRRISTGVLEIYFGNLEKKEG